MAGNGREDKGKPRPKYVWDPQKLAWVEIKETAPSEETAVEPVAEPVKEEVREEVGGVAQEEAIEEGEIEEEAVAAEPVLAGAIPAIEAPPYRGAWIRLLAFDVDLIIIFVIYYIVSKVYGAGITTDDIESTRSTIVLAITIGIAFAYFFVLWGWRGQRCGLFQPGQGFCVWAHR